MLLKHSSEYEKSVEKLKSTFLEFQSTLDHLKNSPLSLPSDLPLINLWLHDKSIKALINAFCVPIDSEVKQNLKIEDLEDYKPRGNECKQEEDGKFIKIKKSLKQKLKNLKEGSSQQNFLQSESQDSEDDIDDNDENEMDSEKKEYKRGPYKNYTVQQKAEAVRMLLEDNCSVIEISRKLKIPCKNIKRWSQQGVERKKGGGRKRFSPETENAVSDYLKKQYQKGDEIPYQDVQEIARSMSDDVSFKASRGWVVKFVDRQQLKGYFKFY